MIESTMSEFVHFMKKDLPNFLLFDKSSLNYYIQLLSLNMLQEQHPIQINVHLLIISIIFSLINIANYFIRLSVIIACNSDSISGITCTNHFPISNIDSYMINGSISIIEY